MIRKKDLANEINDLYREIYALKGAFMKFKFETENKPSFDVGETVGVFMVTDRETVHTWASPYNYAYEYTLFDMSKNTTVKKTEAWLLNYKMGVGDTTHENNKDEKND